MHCSLPAFTFEPCWRKKTNWRFVFLEVEGDIPMIFYLLVNYHFVLYQNSDYTDFYGSNRDICWYIKYKLKYVPSMWWVNKWKVMTKRKCSFSFVLIPVPAGQERFRCFQNCFFISFEVLQCSMLCYAATKIIWKRHNC